jgi:hypothetical protein
MSSDFKSPKKQHVCEAYHTFPSKFIACETPSKREESYDAVISCDVCDMFLFFPSYMRLWLLRRCFSFSPSALLAERTPRREKWSMESLQSTCKAWNIGSHTFIMGALTSSSIFSSCGTCPKQRQDAGSGCRPCQIQRRPFCKRPARDISKRKCTIKIAYVYQ